MAKKVLVSICVLCVSFSLWSSVCISNHGKYENSDIEFYITYHRGNSTPTKARAAVHFDDIEFKIVSKKGTNIYNNTFLIFNGKNYIFTSRDIKDYFFQTGYRRVYNSTLKNGDIIKLVYQIEKDRKQKYFTLRKVEKSFKIILPAGLKTFHNNINIVEI